MTHILLLEDNADMLTMMSQVLEWGGYTVTAGRSGKEGVQLLADASHPPDLVVCDLLMPDMDGLAFLDYVRNHIHWSEIPVVMMSAHSSPQDRQGAIAHGANDFLVKPFNLEDFQKILAKWERS